MALATNKTEKRGGRNLEECPKCKKWTLFYDPRRETMICASCNFQEQMKYEAFVKQRNVVESLRYPSPKETQLEKIEA